MSRRFYLVGLLALATTAACGDGAEEVPEVPVAEQPADPTQMSPAVTEGATVMDTSAVGTVVDLSADTAAADSVI